MRRQVLHQVLVHVLARVRLVHRKRLARPPRRPLEGVVPRVVEAEVVGELAAHDRLLEEGRDRLVRADAPVVGDGADGGEIPVRYAGRRQRWQ